jgi:hypothetical protein
MVMAILNFSINFGEKIRNLGTLVPRDERYTETAVQIYRGVNRQQVA